MSATITYETTGPLPVPTARPDTFWKELVRVFEPRKSNETGDGDPYGVRMIQIEQSKIEALRALVSDGWKEAECLVKALEFTSDPIWVMRDT